MLREHDRARLRVGAAFAALAKAIAAGDRLDRRAGEALEERAEALLEPKLPFGEALGLLAGGVGRTAESPAAASYGHSMSAEAAL